MSSPHNLIHRQFLFNKVSGGSFIPHLVHASIGVLAAITVATATRLAGSPAAILARPPADGRYIIEHPTGNMEVFLDLDDEGDIKGPELCGRRGSSLTALSSPDDGYESLNDIISGPAGAFPPYGHSVAPSSWSFAQP
ncbi:hypothetical protein QO002_005545 [Pararhizobium capsulatum DSM 1112]|uniref:PrpF protein n=1 Tax=Pararhizobium capsulatum DSM 1112 TaxID=1121113 RepID=A0ABU0BYK5_9HYPH|nr:hypothetical protein [Pararhizobium capsulatum]MDQ0323339.1 hypothetical protein [Pararhizobium capsulatum DSM 1112]